MRRQLRDGGFTLVETIVAMVVIVIALFALMSMILNSMTSQETMRELETAKEAANSKMEEIKSHPMQLPPGLLPSGVVSNPNSVYNFYNLAANKSFNVTGLVDKTLVANNQVAQGTIRIDATNPYLYEVLVTIKWTGRKGTVGTGGLARPEYTCRSLIAQ